MTTETFAFVVCNYYGDSAIETDILVHGKGYQMHEVKMLVDECLNNNLEFMMTNNFEGKPAMFSYSAKGKFKTTVK